MQVNSQVVIELLTAMFFIVLWLTFKIIELSFRVLWLAVELAVKAVVIFIVPFIIFLCKRIFSALNGYIDRRKAIAH